MKMRPYILRAVITAAVIGTAHHASAGIMSYTPLSGDADSGINTGLTYTAKADFNGTGNHAVNGVNFFDAGASGPGYSLTGTNNSLIGTNGGANPNNVTGEVGGMINDFLYGGADGNATLTLTGLTIGTQYVTTWYSRAWANPGGRYIFLTASDSPGFFRIDQNFTGNGNGNLIRYTFTATATTQVYSFDAVTNTDTFHHYAVSNAVLNDAVLPRLTNVPVAPRITSQNSGGAQVASVSNSDLLQTQLANTTVTGTANPEGSGGVLALTNGSLTAATGVLTGFYTPDPGATVTFDLNITSNIYGYDISSVRGFGGWQDSGRDQQNYNLYYSLVGSSTFSLLGTVNYDLPATGNPTIITSTFDTALTGVDAIRVEFLGPVENGYTGYGEFDVIGTATVPEPGSLALLLLSAAPLLQRRRRA